MADSSYYYKLYKQNKDTVKSYENELKKLNKVLDNLTDSMGDEIRAVNNKLENLKSDLEKSVHHNSRFSSVANSVTAESEKAVTADSYLSIAVREIQEEISQLNRQKNNAVNERDNLYRKYKEEKTQECKEFFDNIF